MKRCKSFIPIKIINLITYFYLKQLNKKICYRTEKKLCVHLLTYLENDK